MSLWRAMQRENRVLCTKGTELHHIFRVYKRVKAEITQIFKREYLEITPDMKQQLDTIFERAEDLSTKVFFVYIDHRYDCDSRTPNYVDDLEMEDQLDRGTFPCEVKWRAKSVLERLYETRTLLNNAVLKYKFQDEELATLLNTQIITITDTIIRMEGTTSVHDNLCQTCKN